MDAIALSMFVEPAAQPTPRSAAPLPDGTSFDALVAAVANGEEQNVEDAPDTSGDGAMPPSDLMSALVSQWLTQTDRPARPAPGSEIPIEGDFIGDEPALSTDTAAESALPQSQSPIGAADEVPEDGDDIAQTPHDTNVQSDDGPIVSEDAPPDQDSTRVAPRARNEEPKVPFLQLMQQAAQIGWTLPASEAGRASTELAVKAAPESTEGAAAKSTPARVAQSTATFSPDTVETSVNEPAKTPSASQATIGDDAKMADPNQAKTTKTADRADVPELSASTHASARAPESLGQPSPNLQANAMASSEPQAPDTISVPQPSSISAATEGSADMPMKLVATTRDGQTAEMQSLALHIAARWAKGDSRFTIRLDPPELGQIDVSLNVNSHGHAQAVLAVEKPQTLDLLMRDAPTLERALKDAGLEMGGNLSFSLKEEGRQSFARDEQYSSPTKTLELVPAEAPKAQVALNASLVEQLYGLRAARLDIRV